jgi:hypothetical protein
MIRIAIGPAYHAICATLPLGSVAVEPYFNEKGRARRLAGGGLGRPARRDARAEGELQRCDFADRTPQ